MRKRKWRKKILGIGLGALLLLQMAVPVFADDSGLLVDGSLLTDATEAMSEDMFDFHTEAIEENALMPLSMYLYGGGAKITNAGDGKVNCYANTKASETCDTVKVDIYLQYYSNGAWVHVNNWNYTVKNTSYIARSRTVSVTKGRYYRIKCYHAVTKNGVKESSTTVTNGIKID